MKADATLTLQHDETFVELPSHDHLPVQVLHLLIGKTGVVSGIERSVSA
jgi:hypothetical protein